MLNCEDNVKCVPSLSGLPTHNKTISNIFLLPPLFDYCFGSPVSDAFIPLFFIPPNFTGGNCYFCISFEFCSFQPTLCLTVFFLSCGCHFITFFSNLTILWTRQSCRVWTYEGGAQIRQNSRKRSLRPWKRILRKQREYNEELKIQEYTCNYCVCVYSIESLSGIDLFYYFC